MKLRKFLVILAGFVTLALFLLGCEQISLPNPAPNPPPPGGKTTLGQRTKSSGCVSHNALPDSACTPGAIIATATIEQICTPGYSSSVRDVPTEVKNQVYAEYGVTHHIPGEYEVDHLISLELGGSNDIANLWPEPAEPRPGFHEKDQVENFLHQQVCSRAMNLHDAQIAIANNWFQFYGNGNLPNLPPATLPRVAVTSSPPTAATTGRYVASANAREYFYCVTDPEWKKLRADLVWSNSESTFTAKGLKLHAPCQ